MRASFAMAVAFTALVSTSALAADERKVTLNLTGVV
jgi:hypothetical protein